MASAVKDSKVGVMTLLARTATTSLSIATGFLCARFLGPEGRGQLAVLQSLTVTFSPLLFLTLPYSNSYLSAEKEDRLGALLGNSLLLLFCNGLGLWLGLTWLLIEPAWHSLLGPFLWSTGAFSLVMALAMGVGRLSLLNRVETSLNVAVLVALVVAQAYRVCDLEFVVYSRSVANVVAAAVLALAFLRQHILRLDLKLFVRCFDYGIRVTLSNVLWIGITGYSGLALTYYHGPYSAGVFAFAAQCGSLTLVLANTLTSVYFPKFVQMPRCQHAAEMRRLLPRGALLLLFCQILGPLSAPLWLVPLVGPEFKPAIALLTILSPGYFCLSLQLMAAATLTSRKVPGGYLGLLCLVLAVTALLNHGLSGWGSWGAAWAFSGSALVLLLISLVYFARLPDDPESDSRGSSN